jgi:hypothetical protein
VEHGAIKWEGPYGWDKGWRVRCDTLCLVFMHFDGWSCARGWLFWWPPWWCRNDKYCTLANDHTISVSSVGPWKQSNVHTASSVIMYINWAKSGFTSFPPSLLLNHMAFSYQAVPCCGLLLLFPLRCIPVYFILPPHIDPEDDACSVCWKNVTALVFSLAKTSKWKLYIRNNNRFLLLLWHLFRTTVLQPRKLYSS